MSAAIAPLTALGLPLLVIREDDQRWNRALDSLSSLVWLCDGHEPPDPEPLARSLAVQPSASFAVAAVSYSGDRSLAGVLSGTALGYGMLARASALRTVGGIDETAPGAAAAQWDLAVRLAEAGHEWIEVGGFADAGPTLTQRAGPEAARWMYRRHAMLYGRHLERVLLDRERVVGELLALAQEEQRAVEELRTGVTAGRYERDRLAAKLRSPRAVRP